MLSKVMPISQLPSEVKAKLQRVGEFYVCTDFTRDTMGPPVAWIGDLVYYRFMDFFYLPQPPESLDIEQVVEICDLRLKYIDEVVDPGLNKHIVAEAVAHVASNLTHTDSRVKVLDFGCGSGLSSKLLAEHLPKADITGVDISTTAIERSREQGLNAILTYPDKPLPFETGTFDLIFAIFVMHFNVGMPTLVELKRILRPSGKFVFNVYQRDIEGIVQQLEEVGFSSIQVWHVDGVGANHLIVSCGTPAPEPVPAIVK